MRIYRFDSIDSTSTFLKNKEDKENFDLVIAKVQTSGRGRRGNNWSSKEGGAYFSFVLKENKSLDPHKYTKLPLVIGYSLLRTFESLEDKEFLFKWTNDIYVDDKKVSGILVEKKEDNFIIGIGINVNNKVREEESINAISLKNISGKEYDIEKLVIKIIEDFKTNFEFYNKDGWNFILEYLNKKNYLVGKKVTIDFQKEIIGEGIADKISEGGEILININNEKKIFNVGEIHIKL